MLWAVKSATNVFLPFRWEKEIQDCWGSSFSLQNSSGYILPFTRVQWGLIQPFWNLWYPGVRSKLLLCRSFSSIYRCDAAAPPTLEAAFISWTVTSSVASHSHCFNLFCSTVHAARSKQAVLHVSLYACYLSKQWSQQASGAGGCSSTACCFVCLGCLCELCAILVPRAREFPSWGHCRMIVTNILKAGKCGFLVCQTSQCISVPTTWVWAFLAVAKAIWLCKIKQNVMVGWFLLSGIVQSLGPFIWNQICVLCFAFGLLNIPANNCREQWGRWEWSWGGSLVCLSGLKRRRCTLLGEAVCLWSSQVLLFES